MLHKKKKNKHQLPDGDVNVTSLMDILTTLLFFILMVMSLQNFSVMESTSLLSTESDSEDNKPVFTLQITISDEKNGSIFVGPTAELEKKMVDKKRFYAFMSNNFKGDAKNGFYKNVASMDYKKLLYSIQRVLIGVKKGFPSELKAVASFTDKVSYQQMIDSLTAIRELSPEDDAVVYRLPVTNEKELTKVLFPQIIIAEENTGV